MKIVTSRNIISWARLNGCNVIVRPGKLGTKIILTISLPIADAEMSLTLQRTWKGNFKVDDTDLGGITLSVETPKAKASAACQKRILLGTFKPNDYEELFEYYCKEELK